MSVELLLCERTDHQLIDDLEALFWVLIYIALHHCKHGNRTILSDGNIFDGRVTRIREETGEVYVEGGRAKRALLDNLLDFPFACQPLKGVSKELSSLWSQYHLYRSMARQIPEEVARMEKARKNLANPTWLAGKLAKALEQAGWLPDDFVPDQFPRKTQHEVHSHLEATAIARNSGMRLGSVFVSTVGNIRRKLSRATLRSTKELKKRKATYIATSTADMQRGKKRKTVKQVVGSKR